MELILRGYHVSDETWLYLSFLLILAVYFKFSRFWSLRNLDLVLLLLISPGLLLASDKVAQHDPQIAAFGYLWLFAVSAVFLVRTLVDGAIVRRPRLEQNMNAAGMMFLCGATFLFLTTKLLTDKVEASTAESIRQATELVEGEPTTAPPQSGESANKPAPAGPGASLLAGSAAQLSKVVAQGTPRSSTDLDVITVRLIAIFAHLAVIVGLVLVGRHIFADSDLGVAMATLYMLLPVTAFDVGKVNHVLPAVFIVWAVWSYRRPFVSGVLLGLACAMMFFPIFLLPLWAAFYGRRGGLRFLAAVGLTTAAIVSSLLLMSGDSHTFTRELLKFVDWANLHSWFGESQEGFWKGREVAYRIPVFVTYIVILVAVTIWPRRKSLAQVITCSAALVIGTEFWYPQQGGVYVLWYLPLLLLVVFRPHMTNHFAPEPAPLKSLAILRARSSTKREMAASGAGNTVAP
ncbi:MAG: hypothetical protein ACT4QC_05775 [Planctomycetaceae bacterium]